MSGVVGNQLFHYVITDNVTNK